MNFKQFLIEQDDEQIRKEQLSTDAAQMIVDNCQPYLAEVDHDPHMAFELFKGLRRDAGVLFDEKVTRTPRKPMDMPEQVHEYLDSRFEQWFGHRYRSAATFATGDADAASQYSASRSPHHMFPVGQFSYLWSPEMADLFFIFPMQINDRERQHLKAGNPLPEQTKLKIDQIIREADYKQQDLAQAIESGHEIMIATNTYYVIQFGEFGEMVQKKVERLIKGDG